MELLNLFPLEGVHLTLQKVVLTGVSGWNGVTQLLLQVLLSCRVVDSLYRALIIGLYFAARGRGRGRYRHTTLSFGFTQLSGGRSGSNTACNRLPQGPTEKGNGWDTM